MNEEITNTISKKEITLRIPVYIYEALKMISDDTGISLTDLILFSISFHFGYFSNTHRLQ